MKEKMADKNLVILSKVERLILDMTPAVDRIPKSQRFRYAKRLEDALWDLVHLVIQAATSNQKSRVYRTDEQIRFLHALIRHGAERKFLSPKRAGAFGSELAEIGSMLGAWKKRLQGR